MANKLAEMIRILIDAAGWSDDYHPDSDGVWNFALQENLEFSIAPMGDGFAVVFADVGAAPDKETNEGREALLNLGKQTAARMKDFPESVSIHDGRLEFSRRITLIGTEPAQFVEQIQEFLNHLAEFKQRETTPHEFGTGFQFADMSSFSFQMP